MLCTKKSNLVHWLKLNCASEGLAKDECYVVLHTLVPAGSEVEDSQDQGHYEGYDQQDNEDNNS